jgi:hypothetical protein
MAPVTAALLTAALQSFSSHRVRLQVSVGRSSQRIHTHSLFIRDLGVGCADGKMSLARRREPQKIRLPSFCEVLRICSDAHFRFPQDGTSRTLYDLNDLFLNP